MYKSVDNFYGNVIIAAFGHGLIPGYHPALAPVLRLSGPVCGDMRQDSYMPHPALAGALAGEYPTNLVGCAGSRRRATAYPSKSVKYSGE